MKANFQAATDKRRKQLALALQNWLWDVVGEMQKELEAIGAIDQGLTAAATQASTVQDLGSVIQGSVFNPLITAAVLEWGRTPGSTPPPLLPIAAWAARKGITTTIPVNITFGEYEKNWAASAAILRDMGKGGGGKSSNKEIDPVTLDLLKVRLIAKKIAEAGVAGRHPFSRAWERKASTFTQDISATLKL